MVVFRCIVCLGILTVVSLLLGKLVCGKKEQKVLIEWIVGFFSLLAFFEIISLPCIFKKASLKTLALIMLCVIGGLCVLSLLLNRKKIIQRIKSISWKKPDVLWVIVLALIVFQTAMLGFGMHIDEDDAFYVATATTALDTDTLYEIDPYTGQQYYALPSRYVLSPLPMLGAVVGKIIKLRPTIFSHTVLPFYLIPMAYGVYALIGEKIFAGRKDRNALFLFFVSMVNLFSATSVWTQGHFLLVRIWQGKAILANIILPFLLYFALQYFEKSYLTMREWISLICIMLAGCFVSSMGIFLCAVMIEALAFLQMIRSKKIKLFVQTTLASIPNLALAVLYLLIR